jgi:hypothetical protein
MTMKRNKKLLAGLFVLALIMIAGTATAALTTKVIFTLQTQYTGSAGLGTSTDTMNLDYGISLTNGTGANQANVVYSASRSLADDANEVLDFYASGSLTDAFGTALTIETLKVLIVYNTSTEATLKIGGGALACNIFADSSDILALPAGGKFMYSAPDATGLDITTDKDLNFLHGGEGTSALVYKVIAIGVD